ncbi:hypothetical protein [Jeotgalicoccus sp. WY2]|uniref:hypothetical protein n=1 Tax=Jeotgalicoccus sp. WY2 TaxID=2708346 RepID=UPI0035301F16
MSTRNFLILVGSILAVLFFLLALAIKGEMDSGESEVAEETTEESQKEKTEDPAEEKVQDDTKEPALSLNLNDSPLYAVNDDTTPVFQHQSGVDIAYPKEGVKGILLLDFPQAGKECRN